MALTQIQKAGIGNDQVDQQKIADECILNSNINTSAAIQGSKLADNSISLAKLQHGDSNNNGKFLRANNGADPTFEDVPAGGISDVVSDTSPQLGGDLDTNSHHILLDDTHSVRFGASADLEIYHDGSSNDTYITNDTGDLFINNTGTNSDDIFIKATDDISIRVQSNEQAIECIGNGAVELYYNGTKKFVTTDTGVRVENTSSPLTSANSSGNDLVVTGDGAMGLTLHTNGTTQNTSIYFGDNDSSTAGSILYRHQHDQMRFNVNGGNLVQQVNSDLTTYFSGTCYGPGFTVSSDLNLKSNLLPFTNTLDKIKQINGYTFDIKIGENKDQTIASAGIIAQDVEKVFPKLVEEIEGYKTVQYNGLIGVLVEAVKELTTKVESLETEVAALKAK